MFDPLVSGSEISKFIIKQQEQEVVELSSDEESLQPNSEEASDDEPEGDPNREPGADATKTIDPAHLVPFRFRFD